MPVRVFILSQAPVLLRIQGMNMSSSLRCETCGRRIEPGTGYLRLDGRLRHVQCPRRRRSRTIAKPVGGRSRKGGSGSKSS